MQTELTIRRILFATAFNEMSTAASPFACMLAKQHDADLHVLHVVPLPAPVIGGGPDMGAAMNVGDPMVLHRMDEVVKAALDRLKQFTESNIFPKGCRTTPAAVIGIIWDEIINYARDNQIDLIVMGTRRHGMLRRMLLGSITKAVVEHAPCPVLLIPIDDGRSDTTVDKAA